MKMGFLDSFFALENVDMYTGSPTRILKNAASQLVLNYWPIKHIQRHSGPFPLKEIED